jgi:hypothetical protein
LRLIEITAVGTLALGGCGGGCNQTPPSSETCTGTAQGTVTSLDIGRLTGSTYVQYRTGDVIPITQGGQGFPMFVVNLRANGSGLGACLPQSTVETYMGSEEASESEPLVIHQVLPGTWVTGDELLVSFDVLAGDQIHLDATAGGAHASVDLWAGFMASVDAGP